ncbi:RNA polymerase sigma factor RpoH [hydrothermal vent metagenome]|uniref:RNA polymerase sigma factor RpoH n=1 Tax=hydrothermal vent metagenome TaxID=652676 RepID=A0A3B1C205_9ZZZZ
MESKLSEKEKEITPEAINRAIPNCSEKGAGLVPADPLQAYINQVKEYPPLSREEEHELAIKFHKTGDKEAAFRLVTSNLMLVVKISFKFRAQFQNMLDLIQEGNYGLMRAVHKFDPFKGTRLSTYAAYWVRAYMIKFLLDNWRLVKVGTTNVRRKMLYNLRALEEKLKESGAEAGPKLLAEHFGTTEQEVIAVQQSLGAQDTSIYQPVEEGSTRQVIDTITATAGNFAETMGDEEVMERFHSAVEKFKKSLKPSDVTLLESRILSDEPLTLQEIGDKHHVTREAMRQAEGRLLKRLKTYLSEELADIGEIGDIQKKP